MIVEYREDYESKETDWADQEELVCPQCQSDEVHREGGNEYSCPYCGCWFEVIA